MPTGCGVLGHCTTRCRIGPDGSHRLLDSAFPLKGKEPKAEPRNRRFSTPGGPPGGSIASFTAVASSRVKPRTTRRALMRGSARCDSLQVLVPPGGVEPPACSLGRSRSDPLSYGDQVERSVTPCHHRFNRRWAIPSPGCFPVSRHRRDKHTGTEMRGQGTVSCIVLPERLGILSVDVPSARDLAV